MNFTSGIKIIAIIRNKTEACGNFKFQKLFLVFIFLAALFLPSTLLGQNDAVVNILDRNPNILAIARINNLVSFSRNMDKVALEIFPDWFEEGATIKYIGTYLRNTDTASAGTNSFVEIIVYHNKDEEASSWVSVFPSSDPTGYIRKLESRASITTRASGGGIVHMREEHTEKKDFYIATLHDRLVIQGSNRKAIEDIRTLYLEKFSGLMQHASSQFNIYISVKKILRLNTVAIDNAVLMLRNDISRDLSSPEEKEERKNISRMVEGFIKYIRQLADEVIRMQVGFDIGKGNSEIKLQLETEDGQTAAFFRNTKKQTPSIAQYLPGKVTSLSWSSVPSKLIGRYIRNICKILSSGISGSLDADSNEIAEDFLKRIELLVPTEAVSAVLNYKYEEPPANVSSVKGIKNTKVAIFKFEKPENYFKTLNRFLDLTQQDGGMQEYFERNGIDFRRKYVTNSFSFMGNKIDKIRINLTKRQDAILSNLPTASISVEYLLCLKENVLILCNGPKAETAMKNTIASIPNGKVFGKTAFGANLFASIGNKEICSLVAVDPVSFIANSARRVALYGQSHNIGGKPHKSVQFAHEFSKFSPVVSPIIFYSSYHMPAKGILDEIPVIDLSIILPHSSLRQTVRACFESLGS